MENWNGLSVGKVPYSIATGYAEQAAQPAEQAAQPAEQAAQPAETPSRIRDGISNAEQLISSVHEGISQLEKRLETVLRPNAPTPASTQGNPTGTGPSCSHVTGRIYILIEALVQANQRMQELAGRIEV